jgi:hypothetical protein
MEKAQTDTRRRVSVNGNGSFIHLISVFLYFSIIGLSLHFNSLHLFDWFLIRTPLQNNRTSSSRPRSHLLYQEYQPSENAITSSSELATTECCSTMLFCFQRPSRRWWWMTREIKPTPPLLPPSQPKSTVTSVEVAAQTSLLAARPQFSAVSVSTASL